MLGAKEINTEIEFILFENIIRNEKRPIYFMVRGENWWIRTTEDSKENAFCCAMSVNMNGNKCFIL